MPVVEGILSGASDLESFVALANLVNAVSCPPSPKFVPI